MVPMESQGSGGVHFASAWESKTRHLADIGPWMVRKSGHVNITKIEILHIDTHVEKLTDSKIFSIYVEK